MGEMPRWRRYLRFWGRDVDADVDDELRFHLEACAADLVARGHPPDEARQLALARFGDVGRVRGWLRAHDRERHRREERTESMDALLLDLRYALRKLRQQPAFTLAVVLVLGLGIGAATAMFSAVDAALLRPLPFQRDDRLVMVDGVHIPILESTWPKEMPDLADARAQHDVFTHVGAYAPGGLNLADAGAPRRVEVALVTPDFFATLGVQPAHGRGFTEDEGTPDGARVAILSDALWRRQFGGETTAIGRDVRLNEVPHRIVGVMPPGFAFPRETEIWLSLPVPFPSRERSDAFAQHMPSRIVARLAPEATIPQATARMDALVQRFRSAEFRGEPWHVPLVEPFRDVLVGTRRTALLVLMGATVLVLLVACANATNLLLSRGATRRGELALRVALGAGRRRLVQQLLVESVLLAMAGGLLGIGVAYVSLDLLAALLPAQLQGTAPARIDLRVLGFALLLAIGTGVGFGLWPALGASRVDAGETIKGGAAGFTTRDGARARRLFVVAELAFALMLAVGAGLMLRSFRTLVDVPIGLEVERVGTVELALATATYDTSAAPRARFFAGVLARLHGTPGVDAAALVNRLPLRGGTLAFRVTAEDAPPAAPGTRQHAEALNITPDYFRVMGIPLLRGRTLALRADSPGPTEVVINQRLARTLWPDEDPVGRRLIAAGDTQLVVGVVGDVRSFLREEEAELQMYAPLDRFPLSDVAVVARGRADATVLARWIEQAVRAVDPSQAVYNVRPMRDVVAATMASRRANTILITVFGLIAVALAAVGVYGVIAYGVARRTREIGIRVALGARRGDVLTLVAREGLLLAVIGVALGLAGAWALRQVLASLLYGVTPGDPATFAGAALVLLVVAVAATLLPARRALHVDPARTMRVE